MHRSFRLLTPAFVAALLAALSAGCGTTGGMRYARDVDGLRKNLQLTFRIDGVMTDSDGETGVGFGTGVVIHESGLLLTNGHVAKAKDLSIAILENGKTVYYPARVIAISKDHDLAVVKIDRKMENAVRIADDDDLAMLVRVYTAGFPRDIHMTGARGEIARIGVNNDDPRLFLKDDMLVYVEGGYGSSGSGVFLEDGGDLVGLIKMIKLPANDGDVLLGAMVAEPVTHVHPFLEEEKVPHYVHRRGLIWKRRLHHPK